MKIEKKYKEYGSIYETALRLGISEAKVKKALITAGVYENETSREVQRLHAEGKTIQEIADLMEIGKNAVHANLPYSKGEYKREDVSKNALRIRKHRKRRREKP